MGVLHRGGVGVKILIPLTLAFLVLAMVVSGNDAGTVTEIGLLK